MSGVILRIHHRIAQSHVLLSACPSATLPAFGEVSLFLPATFCPCRPTLLRLIAPKTFRRVTLSQYYSGTTQLWNTFPEMYLNNPQSEIRW
jgi:hypothetical protein